jgi:hypothetical protein
VRFTASGPPTTRRLVRVEKEEGGCGLRLLRANGAMLSGNRA